MVWYLTPPPTPSITLSSWGKTLGIHEFRHVTQYSQMNGGFTSLGKTVFGQYGWSTLSSWAYPNWYFEGDAVFNETKYSNSGRGRMPSFSLPLRTIYTQNQKISYEKALFRSYKTYYPNHYYLGYHMVSYINTHYGEDIWNKIIGRTNLFSFWPYSFERSVKKYTGSNIRKTYKKAFNETGQIDIIDITQSTKIKTKKKRSWTNYFDPQIIGKDSLLVLKSGFDDNTTLLYNGKEKAIREISGDNISYAKGKVVWTRYKANIRFQEESFNDIVVYNLETKKLSQITKNGKYFSAEISHNGDKIVAVKYGLDLIPVIVILDMNGKEISNLKGNIDEFFMMPTWSSDDNEIVFIKTDISGESLILYDIQKQSQSVLIQPQWIKFDKAVCYDKYVFFNYDYTGITNIYALNIKTKQIFQVTSKPYAAIQAVVDKENEKIYFSEYNIDGLDIAEMPYNRNNWIPISNIKQQKIEYFKSDLTDSTIQNINTSFTNFNLDSIKTEDYKTGKKLINIHSWSPMIVNENYFGMEFYSNDVMSTTNTTFGAYTDILSGAVFADATIDFMKYFPVFSLSFSSGKMGRVFDSEPDFEAPNTNFWGLDSVANWFQTAVNFGVSIPLNLSKGTYFRTLNVEVNSKFISMTDITPEFVNDLDFDYTQLFTYSTNFSFTNRKYMNFRDIYPKFGQSFVVNYSQAPRFFDLYGYHFYTKATFYLPGILKHDGLKLTASMEQMNQDGVGYYTFNSSVSNPRGYVYLYHDKIYKFTVDYALPLIYPDINIPYLLYIKRIRANFFYDYAKVFDSGMYGKLSSGGLEISFDFNLLRFNHLTFSAGVRASFLIESGDFNYQALFLDIPLNF